MSQTRFTHRFLCISLLAALFAGAMPVVLSAQEAAAKPETTVQAPANKAQEASKPEERKSQEEQNEAFLLDNPMVKWTAKALSVDQKTASNIFLFINFGILVLGVGIPLGRLMPKVIRKRSQTVSANLEEARKATAEANTRLSAIETKLSGLDAEIAAIRTQVEQESLQDEVRIKASIEDEKSRIVAAAEQEIGVAALHARRGLQDYAANLAIEQAAKELILTPESDRALIEEFLHGVGGQN
jgi:F-type H+-transporting ATPase subunit b